MAKRDDKQTEAISRAHSLLQPVYSLAHRRTVGLDAILAEDSPQVDVLSRYRTYLTHFARVNQSPRWLFLPAAPACLANSQTLASMTKVLQQSTLPSCLLALQVHDSALTGSEELLPALKHLRKEGFLIAINEFGVEATNLERLHLLEPDVVKFSHVLLTHAVADTRSRKMLPRLINLMHQTGAMVCLPGVNNEQELLIALDSGADLVQGDYISPAADTPEADATITPRIDRHWDQVMNNELLQRKLSRRRLELTRQAFVQAAIALMQGTAFVHAAHSMLGLPDVIRAFLLDQEGRQIGGNLTRNHQNGHTEVNKYSPLLDATGAIWSRRAYFHHAIDQPGVLYMSDPYLSMTDTLPCVTLSMAIEIADELHVLCADLRLPG